MTIPIYGGFGKWLTEKENKIAHRLLEDFQDLFDEHNVTQTPFLALRCHDVIISHLLARRLEEELLGCTREENQDAEATEASGPNPEPDPAPAPEEPHQTAARKKTKPARSAASPLARHIDDIGKSRERLRKSIKELEEYCARMGTPIDTGNPVLKNPFLSKACKFPDSTMDPCPSAP